MPDFDISRSLNLAGAVLPDYAEIDLDPDHYVIGRDQVYLSETRPFFLENANFFSTSCFTVFHSRRIGKRLFDSRGLYTDSEIIAGGRLTGKSGPVGYGAFYAHTGEAVTDLAAEPESDWGVLRLTHDLTPGGYLGLAGATRLTRPVETAAGERLPGYDYASYALDFDLYFGDGGAWNLAGMAVGSFDSRNTGNAFADHHAVGAEVDYTGEVFDAGIDYEQFTAGFDLDQTGYMWTSGFGLHNANLHGRLRFNLGSASLLRSFWVFCRSNLHWNWGWAPAMQEYGLELSSMTNGGWLFGLEGGYGRDWLFPETGFQDYHYLVPWFNTPYSGMISAHVHGLYGELIDFSSGAVGELFSSYLNLTLRPISALSLSAELDLYDWSFSEDSTGYAGEPVEDYDVLIRTATANYLFSREFYLRLFSRGSSRNDIYTFRALAAWEYLPDSNLYLSYEQWREDTPTAFELINQGVFLKMDYLLQF